MRSEAPCVNPHASLRVTLRAEMAGAWEGLHDSLSAKLSRYGEVDRTWQSHSTRLSGV